MNEHQSVSSNEMVKSLLFLPLIRLFGCISKTARSLFAKRRKIAASLLSLILIVSMLPFGAFTVFAAEGDEPMAEIDSVKYYDLQTAINSIVSGRTIKMLKNVDLSSPITITGDKVINLDLNGKVIKGDQSVAMDNLFYMNTTGFLRISDSGNTGKIIGYAGVKTEDSVFYIEKGNLYIDNVTIEAINLSYETKPQIGRAITLLGSSYLQLDRGRITGNVSTTVYAADLSRVTVTGGTIENLCEKPNNGMALRSASSNIINISGGTIYSKQYFALYAVNGKGAKVKVSGADTAIKSDSYTALYAAGSGTEVYVTGGKIDGYTAGKYDHAMKVRDSACATFTGGEVCNNGHGYGIGGNGKVYIAGGSPVFRTLDLSKVNMSGVDNMDNLLDLSDYLGDIYVSSYSDGWNLRKYTGTGTKKYVTFSTEGYTPVKLNLVLNGGTYNLSVKPEYYASEKGYKLPPASKVSKTGYTLIGWTETNDPSDTNYITEIPAGSTDEKTYYAKYQINQYTLTIDYVGPTWANLPPRYVAYLNYNESYSVATPAIEGATPDRTDVSGTMGAENVFVRITYTANLYSLTYQLNGGSFVSGYNRPTGFYYNGSNVTLPTAENLNAPNGYVLDGWRLTNDPNDNNKITVHNSNTLGNVTYYARWIDVEPPTATIQATTTDSYTNAVTIDKKSDVPQYGWFFTANYVNMRLVANDSSNKPVTVYQIAERRQTGFTSPTADDPRWEKNDSKNYMIISNGDSYVFHFKVVDAAGNVTIVSSDIFTVLRHPTTSTTSLTFGKGSSEDIVFSINPMQSGKDNPGNTFKELRIDDTVLTQGVHYGFEKKGSGYDFITLYSGFLNTLPMGQHTVTAIYYPLNFTDESIYYEGSVLPNPVNIPLTIEKGETKVSLEVSPKNQTRPGSITLTAQLPAGATGTVTYKVNGAVIATVPAGQSVTFKPNGEANLYDFSVSYSGDENYDAAESDYVEYLFQKGNQAALNIEGIPTTVTYGDPNITLSTTGGSGTGAVTYTVVSGPAQIINGNTLRITGAGTVKIKAVKAGDYDYNSTQTEKTITVNKKTVTITGLTAQDKTYDGTTAAQYTGTAVLNGIVSGDSVSLIKGSANFETKNAGDAKAVIFSGFSLTGVDAGKYYLTQPASALATIHKLEVNPIVTIAPKQYDGRTNAKIQSVTLPGVLPGDGVIVSWYNVIVNFTSPNVGENIPINFIGSLSYSGSDTVNYTFNAPVGVKGNIVNNYIAVKGIDYDFDEGWFKYGVTVRAMPGYKISAFDYLTADWRDDMTYVGQNEFTVKFYVRNESTGAISQAVTETLRVDKTAPEADFKIGTSSIKTVFNKITFGLFFKDTQTITIEAFDSQSGVKSIHYYLSSEILNFIQATSITDWKEYTKPISVEPDSKVVVYARVVDNVGNSSICCSDGLVLDATAPVFNGIEDNATYCISRDFTVVEENLDTLTANGTVLIPVNGKYTLSQTGQNVVVAADKAGNSKTVTVTINASHVYDHDCDADCNVCGEVRDVSHSWNTDWSHDEDGHWHECLVCGVKTEIGAHTPAADDGDCTTPILCSVCDRVLIPAKQHEFSGQWHHDEHGHFHMCRNNGCAAADEHHDHSWLEGTPDPAPTYFTECQRIDTCADCNRTKTVVLPILVDDIAPTGTISIGTNRWNSFLNTITFGYFFKETMSVTVESNDSESGIDKTYYFLADRALTIEEAEAITDWTEFEGSFSISPNNSYVVYVKITDKGGNSTIINTDGLVLENIAPVISGAANGYVFCEPVTITVTDDNLMKVTVNGVEVDLTDGQVTIEPVGGEVTVIATDKAGNTKRLTIFVYDGHEWDEGVVTTAPTASTTGEILFTCVHCGEQKTEVLPKTAPTIVDGKENVWNPTDGGTITFKSDAAFADFIRVTVDGIELDAANYELSEGNIIVTLKEEYLKTLAVGTHLLGIESESGTAYAEFTVEAARSNPVLSALAAFFSVLIMILVTFLRTYSVLHG